MLCWYKLLFINLYNDSVMYYVMLLWKWECMWTSLPVFYGHMLLLVLSFIQVILYKLLCLEAKGIQPGLYGKITWPLLINTSALKIVPLVVWIFSEGFVKWFDFAVFCSFWISAVNCKSKKKITVIFLLL